MTKITSATLPTPAVDLTEKIGGQFGTIRADPPWQFQNRTGEGRARASASAALSDDGAAGDHGFADRSVGRRSVAPVSLGVPNALLEEGLRVMKAWGFTYKANIVWFKVRKDSGPDGRGVGFYFRNVTELLLFGVRGSMRTLQAGRTQVNMLATRKREHSRKPDEIFEIIEACSPGPYLERFARFRRDGWAQWGNENVERNSVDNVAHRRGHVEPSCACWSHLRDIEDSSEAEARYRNPYPVFPRPQLPRRGDAT
jgi:hypothetical protein